MSFYKTKVFAAAFMLVGMVAVSQAPANIVTFTDQASWEAALAEAASLETFESAPGDIDFTGSSIGFGDLGLSSIEESVFSNNALIDVSPYLTSGGGINGNVMVSMRFLNLDPADSVTVTLPGGLSAFAFEYNNYDTNGDGAELSFAGTNGQAVTVFAPSTGFFGVVDNGVGATISSFTFTGDGSIGAGTSTFMSFDDVRYGRATAIPEPSSTIILAAVLGLCGVRRRRR